MITATTTSSTSAQLGPTTTTPVATTTTQETPKSLAGRVVVIDPGHNGNNHLHLDEINRLVDIGNGTKACNTTGTSANGYWGIWTVGVEGVRVRVMGTTLLELGEGDIGAAP